jgi:hypothetical protein
MNRVEKYFGASFCVIVLVREHWRGYEWTKTYSQVLVHDLTATEIGMVEMNNTSGLPPAKE